ncbi:NAD-P-binding protein [Trametes coccinea BRFM310]|uniref:NAD-P-binding protein n=1 Tax=Trametes coccinea (strain BRFM310) TaxID=1353009 RepID=A0A1Y2IX76_TRAC3|nr:NAD-P-binding protein [Trametes coccinea BRFM310]
MPALSNASAKILITGANGFIASWTVKAFLDAGFSVRGTVRSHAKAEHLASMFRSCGDRFAYVVVPDMTKDGAFDEAVQGIDAIVHTATPTVLTAEDPAELIDPSVQGTVGLMRAASTQPSVKRVVYLSSCATIIARNAEGHQVYDETSWNNDDVREVEEKVRGASQLAKYRASKIFAEKSAWEYYESNKGKLSWDLAVVNPPWVFGPVIHQVGQSLLEGLNASNKVLFGALTQGAYSLPPHCWVDVRDLAQSLVLSVTTPAAGGQRLIVSAGPFVWEELAAAASEVSQKTRPPPPSYDPAQVTYNIVCNNTKTNNVLGMKYRYGIHDMVRDVIQDWEARGWM